MHSFLKIIGWRNKQNIYLDLSVHKIMTEKRKDRLYQDK